MSAAASDSVVTDLRVAPVPVDVLSLADAKEQLGVLFPDSRSLFSAARIAVPDGWLVMTAITSMSGDSGMALSTVFYPDPDHTWEVAAVTPADRPKKRVDPSSEQSA